MAKANDSIFIKAIYAYLLAIIFSMLFSPLFDKFYKSISVTIPGGGFGVWGNWWVLGLIQNTFFALPFFLPIFVILFIKKWQWLVWLIGIFIPFTFAWVSGNRYLFWFLIFTLAGFILGWVLKLLYEKIIAKK